MHQIRWGTTPLLLGVAVLCVAALAIAEPRSPESDPEAGVLAEITRLNHNIERIAAMLEKSLEGQQLELLIQRVDMGSSRLAAAEQNLRNAKSSRSALFEEKEEMEARLALLAEELDRGSLEMPVEELDAYSRELDLQIKLLTERLREADREINVLENEVMTRRADVRDWQDYIDRELRAGN